MDEGILELGGAAAVEIAASHLAERGGATTKCANCDTSVIGPYCAYCGQERDTHRRSVAGLLRDFFVDLVNVDSRILRTIIALIIKPGELPLAFRQGRTQRYLPAMRLYLFTSLIFFLLLSATGIALIQFEMHVTSYQLNHDKDGNVYSIRNGVRVDMPGFKADKDGNVYLAEAKEAGRNIDMPKMKADGSTNNNITPGMVFFRKINSGHAQLSPVERKVLDSINKDEKEATQKKTSDGHYSAMFYETLRKLSTDPAALNGPMTTWVPRIMFLLLPAYALLLTIFYWRKRKDFYFVDHLVFSLSIHTFGFVLLLLAATAAQVFPGEFVAIATLVLAAIYAWLAMKRFYGQGWFWTSFKFATVSFLYVCFFALPALAGALALSVFGGSVG
jgi:hypothetical protein